MGVAYFTAGRFLRAEKGFKAALRLNPDYEMARNALVLTYIRLGLANKTGP
jgi:Tfp pilus assembly protein PilF